jgi:predicted nucleotidyltransferase
MYISPTLHPKVNEILHILYTNVSEILQDHFVGMYLFGSLANGDFDQHSDIDVLFVTKDEINDKMFSSLQAMHTQLASLDSPWSIQLEVSYIPQKALRRFDPADKLHPHLDRGGGEILHWMAHECNWIIQRHSLRERGIILAGPAPRSLIEPVSASDLRQAVVNILPLWATPILENPLQIRNRGYQSYVVLSLCRMLYTLQCGTIISKRTAAGWAQDSLSKQWIPLIARAWLGRQTSGSDAEPEDVEGTLKFIRYTMEYSQQLLKNESQNV